MSRWPVTLLLVAFSVISAYLLFTAADFVPVFFHVAYKVSYSEIGLFMPRITGVACKSAPALALICGFCAMFTVIWINRRKTDSVLPLMLCLCTQGLILWLAAFGFCYDGFLGGMTMHSGPDFDMGQFLQFEDGVFPVTLIVLIAPLVWLFATRKRSKPIANGQA